MTRFAKMLSTTLFGAVCAAGPLAAQTVTVDYDHSINFLKFKTYTLQKVHATDPGVENRITIAVDRNLTQRYLHTADKDPELMVAVVESNQDAKEYSTFYDGLGGLNWQRGWGAGGFMDNAATVSDVPAGTLVMNIWDGKTQKLIWRGTITEPASVTSSKEADQKMDKAVGQLLAQFPPKFKK